jgi:acyl-CoA thioester hydrolase
LSVELIIHQTLSQAEGHHLRWLFSWFQKKRSLQSGCFSFNFVTNNFMETFIKKIDIRWSDLDPNFHLRHSAYYDFGAYCRVCFLKITGLTPQVLMQHNIGPVLFREECIFRKEIHFGDNITIDLQLDKSTANFSRWTMKHRIWRDAEILCAVITIDGAWIDTRLRKLTAVPDNFSAKALEIIPKTENFILSEKK